MTTTTTEIDEIIAYIHQHIYDSLPLARLASHVAYSPYHFTRLFKERMGISPMYYVSSIRLQKAKDLLLQTNLSVRDISLEIGQQSLGTFTTRFTERVGMTPAQFRNTAQDASRHLQSLEQLSDWATPFLSQSRHSAVRGTVSSEYPFSGVVLIGLFPKPIPEGFPLYGTLIGSLGEFELTDVEPGIYYLMATTISWGTGVLDMLLPHSTLRTRYREAVVVRPDEELPPLNVTLYPPALDDPPILISLPVLMNHFLTRVQKKEQYRV
ncbi:helix-turn-helix transcriptional regulator [Paenibacillus paeoniae]|uniref:AraC family transcriptional regulator n=1 Tax=Paenibacillus paeoniae TaxID=2292705 RepID=A0A371PP28_9BACL|nr:AraC family transcriptional regulator [Paenibacillus paeoniae]REK77903.1 AraC family transcriptional regulator [Paenibacillus paeoniae]